MKFAKPVVFVAVSALACVLTACRSKTTEDACVIRNGSLQVGVHLKKKNDSAYALISASKADGHDKQISEWKLDYPVYHFECGDMDGDGTDDVVVGVIKKTRFDSTSRKRIFMFKLVEGYIRPLWLGSRVAHPLEDFRVVRADSANIVRTIEQEQNGSYLVAEYKWKSFGLTFIRYIFRNINLTRARQELAKTP